MKPKPKSQFMEIWPQWLAAFEVFVLKMLTGMALGLLPPLLGLLNSKDSPYKATKAEISWIASLMGLTQPLGVFSGSLAATYFGPKQSINICVFFLLIGWIFLMLVSEIKGFYITFICIGLSLGAALATYPIYISEIAASNIRGRLISFVHQGLMIGLLLGNVMATHLSLVTYATTCMTIAIFFFITFYFIPETPQYMIRLNKMEKAAKSMRWYNRSRDIKKELAELREFLDSSPKLPFLPTLNALFKNPVNRKALLKMSIFCISLQITGLQTIGEFMAIILRDAKITALKPNTMVSILTFINIPASWIPLITMDKYKRKYMYSIACAMATLAQIGFASTFTLLDLKNTDLNIQWIIIISAIVDRLTMATTLKPVFMTFTSEIFAPNVKTMSISIVFIVNGIMNFLTHKYLIMIVDLLSYKYMFYLLAGFTLFHGIYVKQVMPETKGKTLQEIQKMLDVKRNDEKYIDPNIKSLLLPAI